MSRIRKLSASVVNQIAAGEVVIQPCSVLKELVENAFDASATRVDISFHGSGADELKVSDDGMGMDREDLLLSVEAHATSKIECAADLYRVASCGFRGEALASIAEVSRIEITSCDNDAGQAHRLVSDPPSGFAISACSRPRGTTLSVRDLFHNVPVRRRFLKSERSETGYNLDILKKLSLSRPWIGMRVLHNDKICFELSVDQDVTARLRDLEIFDKKSELASIDGREGSIALSGCLALPPTHFGNGQKIHLFVNRRPITDKSLAHAIVQAFASHIPERRFPGVVLYIDMPPEEVDVNIHPTKSQVRFRDSDTLYRMVLNTLRQTLEDRSQDVDSAPTQTVVYKRSGLPKTIPMNRGYGRVWEGPAAQPFGGTGRSQQVASPGLLWDKNINKIPTDPDAASTFPQSEHVQTAAPPDNTPPRALQLLNRFIVLERDEHFEIMDQHAVHERVLYNQLAHEERDKSIATQSLLAPVDLAWPAGISDLSADDFREFERMGFDLVCGREGVEIRGIPDILNPESALAVLETCLAMLGEGRKPQREDLRRDMLHSMACRAAVKAGDALGSDELRNIVAAYLTLGTTQGSCPHGRSVVWKISIAEANARFDR